LEDQTKDVLRLTAVGLVILVTVLGWWHSPFPLDPLAALTIAVAGLPIFTDAYAALRSRAITMEVAMTIGIAASFAAGEPLASLIVVFFTLASEAIEERTVDRSRRAIEDLVALAPRTARVKRGNAIVEVAIEALATGDVVVIRPGERIPVDGSVVAGAAVVNQAPITGEAAPVEKGVGQTVFAGTVNQRGVLEVEALTVGEDTTLGRIITLVEEAEASKAPVQRFADRFAARFVPLVLLLAALVVLLSQNITSAVAVIVVACPCAVAIATPLAVVASVGKAAKGGVIIKGGAYLEALSRVTTVVVDKTGTLTLGEPQVTDVTGFDGHSDREIITLAAIAEQHSEHHLADAVARKAVEYDVTVPPHHSCHILAGKGVICEYAETTILMGNRELMADHALAVPPAVEAYLKAREEEGKTTMIVAHDRHVCGVISVADVVRRETREGLKALQRLGIHDVIMMTGDTARAAKAIAEQVGVDAVMAEMLPEDKVKAVRGLVQQGKTVLMVGDGVNDAPALAEASVGVAMGVAGSDVAIEAADVVLMTDDFRDLAHAIQIGRRAVTNIQENIGASVLFNLLGITLAALGVLSPITAAAVHALPDVILFLNASRLFT
jgi:heavy metal translocating P-type ATPase